MRQSILFNVACVIVAMLISGCGPGKLDLHFTPALGEPRTITFSENVKVTTTIQGREQVTSKQVNYKLDFNVASFNTMGEDYNDYWDINFSFREAEFEFVTEISPDLTNSQDLKMAQVFTAMEKVAGESFSASVESDGTVRLITASGLVDKLMNAASITEPAAQGMVRKFIGQEFSENALRDLLGKVFRCYGEESVSIGDTWTDTGTFGLRSAVLIGESMSKLISREESSGSFNQSFSVPQGKTGSYTLVPGLELVFQASGSGNGEGVFKQNISHTNWPQPYVSNVKLSGTATAVRSTLGATPFPVDIEVETHISVE